MSWTVVNGIGTVMAGSRPACLRTLCATRTTAETTPPDPANSSGVQAKTKTMSEPV